MLPSGPEHDLVDGPPPLDDYLRLRADAGLSARSSGQAAAGLHGAWAACHALHAPSGCAVGMGRVIGDGGWYFHIIDMAVLPDHQRLGLGAAILEWLLERVRRDAPSGAVVNLLTDVPGRALYPRHGFEPTARGSIGMALVL